MDGEGGSGRRVEKLPSPSIERGPRGEVLLLAILLLACARIEQAPGENALPPKLVRTRAMTVEARREERRFSGYVYPWDAHGVGFLIAGRVKALHVDLGDRVTRGHLLAELVPEDYALVQQLSEIQVQALAPNVDRVDALVEEKVLPAVTQDEVRGKYLAALTQRNQARRQLAYTRLEAPIDGVVLRRDTAVGQVIGAGMPAVTVVELDRVKLKLGVPQQGLAPFEKGRALEVAVPGLEGHWTGVVHSVGLVPDAKTRTYEVALAIDNADGRLRPGLLAHVRLVTREKSALFVPLHLVKHDRSGRAVTWLFDAATSMVVERPVRLGEGFGTDVEVTEGLTAGDALITDGEGFVVVGEGVRSQPEDAP
jgi:RND family efflux transporter MFP subunit